MSDFSKNYAVDKNSMITISKNNVFVNFKPFIDSYSFEKSVNTIQVEGVYDIGSRLLSEESERKYKLSFNVPSVSHEDAKKNHTKFQKLLRMVLPNKETNQSFFYIKFANLIQKEKAENFSISDSVDSESYVDFVENYAVRCKVSNLNYSPDMEMGFFDEGGMFFAKNFKLDLDLEVQQESYPKGKHYGTAQIDNPKLKNKIIKVGNLFGFPINYGD